MAKFVVDLTDLEMNRIRYGDWAMFSDEGDNLLGEALLRWWTQDGVESVSEVRLPVSDALYYAVGDYLEALRHENELLNEANDTDVRGIVFRALEDLAARFVPKA